MINKHLTIAIPTYNMSGYLDRCLSSFFCGKDLSLLEILVIDDGSTDNTSETAKKYVEEYPSIIKYVKQENRGHGNAVNKAILMASGKYFWLVDADDFVDATHLVALLDNLKEITSDMVICNYFVFNEKNKRKKKINFCNFAEVNKTLAELNLKKPFPIESVIFKTDIVKQIKIQDRCYFDDHEYTLYPIQYINTISLLPLDIYVKTIGRENQNISQKGLFTYRKDHQKIIENLIVYFNKNKSSFNLETYMYVFNAIRDMIIRHYNYYVLFLKRNIDLVDEIVSFDEYIQKKSVPFYIASEDCSKFKYIKKWRNLKFKRIPILRANIL